METNCRILTCTMYRPAENTTAAEKQVVQHRSVSLSFINVSISLNPQVNLSNTDFLFGRHLKLTQVVRGKLFYLCSKFLSKGCYLFGKSAEALTKDDSNHLLKF